MNDQKTTKPKPTILQTWIASAGLALWTWWMLFSWVVVVIFTFGGYFGIEFWGWLALALLAVGFRFVLERWCESIVGKPEDAEDYDPNRYPWWGRKIRFRVPHREKPPLEEEAR